MRRGEWLPGAHAPVSAAQAPAFPARRSPQRRTRSASPENSSRPSRCPGQPGSGRATARAANPVGVVLGAAAGAHLGGAGSGQQLLAGELAILPSSCVSAAQLVRPDSRLADGRQALVCVEGNPTR